MTTAALPGLLRGAIPRHNAMISLAILVVVTAVLTSTTSGLILAPRALRLFATFGPETLLITVGMAFVLLIGHLDLSIGAIYVFSSVTVGWAVTSAGLSTWAAVPLAIAVAALLGLVNGLLVVGTGISSFVVTLGTMWGFSGLMLVLFGSTTIPVPRSPGDALTVLTGPVAGLPAQVLWAIGIVALLAVLRSRTRLGSWMQATGSNLRASRMMGIPTRAVTVRVFVLSGAVAGFAGVIRVAHSQQAVPQSGQDMMLMALAGAIVGGVSLRGGRGGVVGPFLGALTLLVISTGLIMMGIVDYWTNIIVACAVIATAWAFDRLESQRVRVAS